MNDAYILLWWIVIVGLGVLKTLEYRIKATFWIDFWSVTEIKHLIKSRRIIFLNLSSLISRASKLHLFNAT